MKPRTLLLWDIDGTLVTTGHAGEIALMDALHGKFNIRDNLDGVEIAGRTDRAIATQILAKFNLPDTLENTARFLDGYIEALAARLPERRAHGRVLPGIVEILEETHRRPDLAQGLLTGNLHRGAKLKLEQYGVFHYFEFGAFADDHPDRNQLPPHAKRRAEERHGVEFPPDRIFVIGDTPHDIRCGQAIGARTLGVATGRYSVDDLKATGATRVFPDLSDTRAFFNAVGANSN